MWKAETLTGRAVWAHGEALYHAVDKRRHEVVKQLLAQGVHTARPAPRPRA
jgi:hypothetical protein